MHRGRRAWLIGGIGLIAFSFVSEFVSPAAAPDRGGCAELIRLGGDGLVTPRDSAAARAPRVRMR